MSRVRLVQKHQAPPEVKELYDKIEANGAKVLNLYKALAHTPSILPHFLRLGNSLIGKTKLSPKLRELAILRIARLSGSEYEWTQHYPIALEVGVSRRRAESISQWKDSPDFTDIERAVLQYVDEAARKVTVKDKTFQNLKQYLDEQEIVELTAGIGYWEMVARVLVALEIDIDTESVGSAKELIGRKH